jgi:tetratricopeptide (TPR) repeat protein
MAVTFVRWQRAGALLAGLVLLAGGAGRADDKENPLREQLLKLNGIATEEAQTAKLRELVKDKAKGKAAVAEAVKMMKEAKEGDKPFNYNGTLILAKAAHYLRDYTAAERLYEHLVDVAAKLKNGTKIRDANEGLIELYWDARRYADVVDACEKLLETPGPEEVVALKPFVLERMIQAKVKQGKIEEAMTITKGYLDLYENSWFFLEIKGWIQREDGKIADAIATYNDVIDKLDADKTLKADSRDRIKDNVRYLLSGLYVDNNDLGKAAKQLQTLIKRKQDDLEQLAKRKNPDDEKEAKKLRDEELRDRRNLAGYKNDLGYVWADHDMNLEESEKLVKEAIDLDKQVKEKLKESGDLEEVKPNAAYTDSLGWVLFKQKKYKEALEQLKKAAEDEDDGSHLEIWDHLADCYMAMGRKKEAVAAWEKALKFEDLTKRDGERRRKVSEKLREARADVKTKD